MHENRLWLGKTALQKLVYLLQTVFNVPVGYQYSLYIHGPFCSDLMDDLDYVDALGGVSVTFDHSANGYSISPAKEAKLIKSKAGDFLETFQPQIDKLLADFGSMRARELELRSTIVFIDRDALRSERDLSKEEFVREIECYN